MNNAIIITTTKKDPLDDLIGLETEEMTLTRLIRSLENLKDNVHFKRYIAHVVYPKLLKKEKQLAKEKEPVSMYRLQGSIEELQEFSIDRIELSIKNYKNKLNKIIWQKNNPKK